MIEALHRIELGGSVDHGQSIDVLTVSAQLPKRSQRDVLEILFRRRTLSLLHSAVDEVVVEACLSKIKVMTGITAFPVTSLVEENYIVLRDCLAQMVMLATIVDVAIGEAVCVDDACSHEYILKLLTLTRCIPLSDACVPRQW